MSLMFLIKEYFPEARTLITGIKPVVALSSNSPLEGSKSYSPVFLPQGWEPIFGRISNLREPAGKIRKIAIVDPLSQWLLKPIHDWMFSILRKIPNDGTFDQSKPALVLMDLVRKSKGKFLASLDMSDATDRLASILQRTILTPFLGVNISYSWHKFLTDRPYQRGFGKEPLYYAVGQPMGALSSFSNLAFTHHFLWQWAA